ncbi:MAG: UbiA family prenyltransferase [Candidatus Moraniibacteriota bacterium]
MLIIIPPIIDSIISTLYFDGIHFKSYYLFDSIQGLSQSFITFFGDKPRDGITYGTRVMIFLSLLLLTFITYVNTKKIYLSILMLIIAYTLFFLLSSMPSLITFMTVPEHLTATRADVAGLIASPTTIFGNQITNLLSAINIKMSLVYLLLSILITITILFFTYKKTTISLVKNIRPIQTLYHLGLLLIGIGLAIIFADSVLYYSFFNLLAFVLLCIAIIFAWYSTVIFNDCVDQKIDAISNQNRPLIQKTIALSDYKKIGLILMFLSIIMIAAINPYASLLIIAYHALSYLYNMPPLRLKRFPIIATLLAAIASFFIVAVGFVTVSPEHSLTGFPPYIAILLIISYTISLPIKDLKDIAGDKANNVYTLPVLFGEKTGRTIIGMSIFFSFMLSIFTLGTKSILLPAILSGALCFWTLVGQKNNKFIFTPKQTLSLVFVIVSIYGMILVFTLFG